MATKLHFNSKKRFLSSLFNLVLSKIQAHESAVWQLSWADPKYGSLLASASFDKRVLLHQEGIDGQWRVVYSFEDNKTSGELIN